MTKLSILMATTDGKIEENQSFYSLPFNENFTAIVVNQKINSDEDLKVENPYIKIFNFKEKGISNSRNFALQHANSQYVHFCDDDVAFLPNYLATISKNIKEYPVTDFFRFQIQTPDGKPFKKYENSNYFLRSNSIFNKRKILLISSIEILGKLKTIKEKHLRFDTRFGVGSGQFPMGEEALFLLDALEKGCKIRAVNTPIVIHEEESSGSHLEQKELQTLGILFKRVMGVFHIPFKLYYALKKRNTLTENGIRIWQAFQWMNQK